MLRQTGRDLQARPFLHLAKDVDECICLNRPVRCGSLQEENAEGLGQMQTLSLTAPKHTLG